jgi:hypothetical protein
MLGKSSQMEASANIGGPTPSMPSDLSIDGHAHKNGLAYAV